MSHDENNRILLKLKRKVYFDIRRRSTNSSIDHLRLIKQKLYVDSVTMCCDKGENHIISNQMREFCYSCDYTGNIFSGNVMKYTESL